MRVQPDELDVKNFAKFAELYPDVKVRAIRVYQDMWRVHGVRMRCTEAERSMERQERLYAQGRTTPGKIVTWSKPGNSLHHFWCAFDSCFAGGDPYLEELAKTNPAEARRLWEAFGFLCEAHGLSWGGRWLYEKRDMPHAQLTYGLKISEIQALSAHGGKEAVFAKFDQITGAKNV